MLLRRSMSRLAGVQCIRFALKLARQIEQGLALMLWVARGNHSAAVRPQA
jgi:hypothetical protein